MQKDVEYAAHLDRVMEQMPKGAFLTVKVGHEINTMTIGWALVGVIWRRPVMLVAVRDSRHTFKLMEKANDFTISVPWEDKAKELAFCGTKSGAVVDKFAECALEPIASRHAISPIIALQGLHYECRIVYKSAMNASFLARELESLYPAKDYHTLYFGEILACYET